MTDKTSKDPALQRRRNFLKSLAAAAGVAAFSTEQAFGASLLLRSQEPIPHQDKQKYCTTSGTVTESRTYVLQSCETAATDLPGGEPGTFTQSFSVPASQSSTVVETFTNSVPAPASYTRTTKVVRQNKPNKSHSGVITYSFDGKNVTTTVKRPFDLTVSESTTKTISVSYPCDGDQSLKLPTSGEQLVAAQLTGLSRNTIDSSADLLNVVTRGGSLRCLNV